jgi:superfamily I DNA and/or RNA helicase/predicted RNA-binding Zn-ribbon protein involved in translation (DUF1610 family)
MVEALNLEIQEIKKKGSTNWIELRGGVHRGVAEGSVLYAFPVTEEIYLRDESPVRVVVGQEEADGIIVSLNKNVLVVGLERDFGATIPFARLISDDTFLLVKLRDKLVDVQAGTKVFNEQKANQTIGLQPSRVDKAAVEESLSLGQAVLDSEQEACISTALGSDVTYLWGPPGTGKTTVLARIVEGYYRAGLSVLVVSNTNIAVDTALEKICDRLKTDTGFQKGLVLRYGPSVKPELLQTYKDQVVLDNVIARLGRGLHEDKASLEAERAKAEAQAKPLRQAISELEQMEEAKRYVLNLRKTLDRAQAVHQDNQARMASITQKLQSLRSELERTRGMSPIRRFFSGLDTPDRLNKVIGASEAERAALKDAIASLSVEVVSEKQQLQEGEERLRSLSERVRGYPSCSDCRKMLDNCEKLVGELTHRISDIQKQIDALRDNVIKACRILATTVYRTWLKGQIERSFDAVVIDEASMLALPMSFFAAGLAKHHIVVAGDFRQLPPIVLADEPMVIDWLKQDVFHKAGIAEAVKHGEWPKALVALRTQYRMHKDICSLANAIFYEDHPLQTSASVHSRPRDHFPFGDSALLYVDTTPYRPWASLRLGTYSRYNLLHALLLRNVAFHLHARGYLVSTGDSNTTLGIVAPYTAQTRLIQRLIDERLDNRGTEIAATVHRFQGNEKDTMLVDLTDSIGARLSKFMRAVDINEDGARLLNVALSRARHHVVLVANFEYLRQKAPRQSKVLEVLELFEKSGEQLEIKDLLRLGPEDWIDALRPVNTSQFELDPSKLGAFSEGTFYAAFLHDLISATRSIVIFSPFLTSRGAGRWVDALRAKVSAGIPVRLVTRPSGDQGGILEEGLDELVAGIRQLGVVVDLRARMHEKLAIIDNETLWVGSLNIFSHRDTSETMFRIPSRAACEEIVKLAASPSKGGSRSREPEIDFAARENPECPNCSAVTVWKNGRYGIYFECANCGNKLNLHDQVTDRVCPDCGGSMRIRRGAHGRFFACSNYPQCGHTERAG